MESNEQAGQERLNENFTDNTIHDIGVASQMGSFSDAIEVASGQRWLFTSGIPGLSQKGDLPNNIKEQSVLAWENISTLLKAAGMTVGDIVKVTQYLTQVENIQEYAKIRKCYLCDVKPASTLLITPQLGWPNMLVEVEVIAAKKA